MSVDCHCSMELGSTTRLVSMSTHERVHATMKMYIVFAVCAILAFIVYMPTFKGGFTNDDAHAILKNPNIRSTTPWSKIFFDDFWGMPIIHASSRKSYRPICTLSFRLNYILGKSDPFGYHLVNVVLHAIATSLVSITASRLCDRLIPSLMSGVLFALHPIHTEAVAGIVGRADIGAGIFFLLSFNCYMNYCINRDIFPHKSRLPFLILSIVFTSLSVFTKEHGITVFAVNVIFDVVRSNYWKHWLRLRDVLKMFITQLFTPGIGSQIVCGIILLVMRVSIMGGAPDFVPSDNPASHSDSLLTRILTFLYLPAFNGWLLLNPFTLCYDWTMNSIPLIESVNDRRNLCTVIFYLSFVPFTLYISREMEFERLYVTKFNVPSDLQTNRANNKRNHEKVKKIKVSRQHLMTSIRQLHHIDDRNVEEWNREGADCEKSKTTPDVLIVIISFAILILPFIPASNLFFYVGFVVAERILYLPSIGFCLLLAMGFNQLYVQYQQGCHGNPNAMRTIMFQFMFYSGLIMVVILYAAKTHVRNHEWNSNEKLFRSGLKFNPVKSWLNLADDLKEQNRLNEAEQAYRQAVRHHPEWTNANYEYGIHLQDLGQLEDAIKQYREAVKHHPQVSVGHLKLGSVLYKLKHTEEAERIWLYATTLNTTHPREPQRQLTGIVSAYAHLGKLYLETNRIQDAIASLEKVLEIKPNNYESVNIYRMLGESYSQLGNYVKSETLFKTALADNSNNGKAYLAFALMLQQMERFDEAEFNFRKGLTLEPHNEQGYEIFHTFLNDRGMYQDSFDLLSKGLKLMPYNWNLNYYIATTLIHMKDSGQAEGYFRKLTEVQPNDPEGYRNLAAVLHMNQKPEEALVCYEEALKLKPGDQETIDNLRKSKEQIKRKKQKEAQELLAIETFDRKDGKLQEALEVFRKLVELTPQDKNAHLNLGAILYLSGQPEEAELSYFKALEISPDDSVTVGNLKKTQQKIKDKGLAREHLKKATALQKAGEFEEAEELFREICELVPDDISAYKNLGDILYLNNKPEEAERLYVGILENNPEEEEVKKNLARTQKKLKIKWEEKARELLAQGIDLKEAGDIQDAEETFKKIVEFTPEDAKAHRNLGDILRMNNKLAEARASYVEALRLKPGDMLTTQYLEEIHTALEQEEERQTVEGAFQGVLKEDGGVMLNFEFDL